jgi:glyoxylase-like metal-dependent hydrolase (beta-lactamase superfamily II)
MSDVLEVADRFWRGELSTADSNPVGHAGGFAEVCDGVVFVPSFAKVTAFATGDGLVLVDTAAEFMAESVHQESRRWTGERLHTAVYSHGHIDHVFGVPVWEAESAEQGWPAPVVIAHEALPPRFDRYILTAGYNQVINRRQFGVPHLRWPVEPALPEGVGGRAAPDDRARSRVPAAWARVSDRRRRPGHPSADRHRRPA